MIGKRVGPYEFTALLGEGTFGEVWAAVDSRLGRKVAIKTLKAEVRADQASISRFQSEARNLAVLNHTNITMLLDIYDHGSSEMMIMEFVPGSTLESLLERHRQLSIRESLVVLLEASAGLGYAHQRGLTHRDIKPSNLMVSEDGILKVMDFGIARAKGTQRQTKSGQAMGTPLYLSPEQCRGKEGDERSDQYSLAAVLHELLSGRPPFEADNDFDLMRAHLEASPPPLGKFVPKIPKALEKAVLKALSKAPEDRFPTIREFADAAGVTAVARDSASILRGLLAAEDGPSHAEAKRTEIFEATRDDDSPESENATSRGRARQWLIAAAITGCAVLVGVIGAHEILDNRDETLAKLPAPPEQADLKGVITNVLSGNAIAVNGTTASLYGVSDNILNAQDVLAAQEKLRPVLPKEVLCYKKTAKNYQCFEAVAPHRDIALIALDKGVAKPRTDESGNEYRAQLQPH